MPPPHAHNAHPRDGRALYIKKPGCFQTLWTRCVDGTNCTEVAIVRCATRPCLRAIDPSVPLQAVGNHSHFRGRLPPVPADPEDENAPGQPLPLITPASHWSDNLRAGASPGPGGGNVTPPPCRPNGSLGSGSGSKQWPPSGTVARKHYPKTSMKLRRIVQTRHTFG